MSETLKFDHYEVQNRVDGSLEELGRGAMGVTYKAFDTNLRIPVALKVINGASINSELARQRFVREARAAAALRHPNVASVFHLGIDGDTYFYAMEFVDGETIESLIRRAGPVEPLLALKIVIQVARALSAAAKLELVHRDIKPANLMVLHQDEELVVKVIDFGLAKSSKGDGEELATVSMGGFVGTPHFASPEQLEEKDLDVRSDIYSLGVTLWYMLAGRTPFGGSLAQVMSQHLSKPPPFEQLALAPCMVSLLQRMLAKEAEERFQTAPELRREAEVCAEILLKGTSGQTAVVSNPEANKATAATMDGIAPDNFETVVSETIAAPANPFQIGAVIGGQYELVQKIDEATYRARVEGTGEEVELTLLQKDLPAEKLARIDEHARQAAGLVHPNWLRCHGLEEFAGYKFIAIETVQGCAVLDLLRARRELTGTEVALLLEPAAKGIDFALESGATALGITLQATVLSLGISLPEGQLRQPLDQWPAFTLKINPVMIARENALSQTWAGQQTIAKRATSNGEVIGKTGLIIGLGRMVYELLGGNLQQIDSNAGTVRYVPLASLSEKGNAVLKQALDPTTGYGSAGEFYEAFIRELAPGRNVAALPRLRDRRGIDLPPILKKTEDSTVRQLRDRRPRTWVWMGVGAVLVFAGGLLFLPWPISQNSQKPVAAKPPEVIPAESSPVPAPVAVAVATPIPTPSAAPVATPAPSPTREELLSQRLSAVKELEEKNAWKRCLHEYVQIAGDFPESDSARVGLELIIPKLAKQLENASDAEFDEVRGDLTKAARIEVVSAMTLLGRSLKKREPALAFSWFKSAAEKGYAPAMTQAGLMYSNGLGVGLDLSKAFELFQQAAAKGDAVAKTCLGECLLHGKGVTMNKSKAVEILQEAADVNEPRAMNLLGTCYHQGIGTAKDFNKALNLFKRAGDAGFADALGNQGVLYMTGGEGVKKDELHAVDLFQKGARLGSLYTMFLLGQCYEAGIGVEENRAEAIGWYRKSALGGNELARKWCKANQVEP